MCVSVLCCAHVSASCSEHCVCTLHVPGVHISVHISACECVCVFMAPVLSPSVTHTLKRQAEAEPAPSAASPQKWQAPCKHQDEIIPEARLI